MAPELLGQVDLAGRVVTGDALYAQKNLSRQVVEQGGDYFWVVKDNQPTLRADIALLFAEPPWGEELATAGECGRHGDRWEERTLWTSTALNEYLDWPQVRQVCCVERKVTRKGATRKELAYAITSLSPAQAGPQELLCLWRSHWEIENRLHYVRDVTMKEDASQVIIANPTRPRKCRRLERPWPVFRPIDPLSLEGEGGVRLKCRNATNVAHERGHPHPNPPSEGEETIERLCPASWLMARRKGSCLGYLH